MATLYKMDVSGKMRVWEITMHLNSLIISYGELGGAEQTKVEKIERGLGGRTLQEQIRSRYYSRINEQYKKGYKDSYLQAEQAAGTNAMGLNRPMLAQPIKKVKGLDLTNAYAQYKYDGHRCLITNVNGQIVAYSRQGKVIDSIGHILDDLRIPEGCTIDGELYCHGATLQSITSWIKREQDATKNLKYHAYDMISYKPFNERFNELDNLVACNSNIIVVPTKPVKSEDDISQMFIEARHLGYEGAIIRWGDAGYEVGKRSKHLAKVKGFTDQEFRVVDIVPSKDGWGVLECSLPDGNTFRVTAPGSYGEKTKVLEHKEEYIGRMVTVEYANLTSDGVPFHPVAIRFRSEI